MYSDSWAIFVISLCIRFLNIYNKQRGKAGVSDTGGHRAQNTTSVHDVCVCVWHCTYVARGSCSRLLVADAGTGCTQLSLDGCCCCC